MLDTKDFTDWISDTSKLGPNVDKALLPSSTSVAGETTRVDNLSLLDGSILDSYVPKDNLPNYPAKTTVIPPPPEKAEGIVLTLIGTTWNDQIKEIFTYVEFEITRDPHTRDKFYLLAIANSKTDTVNVGGRDIKFVRCEIEKIERNNMVELFVTQIWTKHGNNVPATDLYQSTWRWPHNP